MKGILAVAMSVLGAVLLYWTIVYVLGCPRFIMLALLPVSALLFVVVLFVVQNQRTLGMRRVVMSVPLALLSYVPVALVAAPGVYAIHCIEKAAHQITETLHNECCDQITIEPREERISTEVSDSTWWKPWTWGHVILKTEMRRYKVEVLKKAALYEKALYGSIVSVLDLITTASRLAVLLALASSFGYVLAVVAITRQGLRVKL